MEISERSLRGADMLADNHFRVCLHVSVRASWVTGLLTP